MQGQNVSIPVYFWFPTFGCVVLGSFFMNIPPVADQFMDLFGVGYAGLSFFLSAVYWAHALFQVPGGLAVDRLGVVRSLLICLGIMVAANLVPLFAPQNFSLAVSMRLVLGMVTGAMGLVMIKIIKILTPSNHIARMQGAHGAAFSMGTMLPYLYLPLAGNCGWIAAYLSSAMLCVILGLCMFRLPLGRLRETRETETFADIWRAMKTIATSRTIWLMGCCQGFFFGTINTLGNWLPSMLADIRENSSVEDWALAASALLLAGTAARVYGSELIGKMTRWQIITRVLLITGILYWALAFCNNAVLFFCLGLAMAIVCGFTFASVFTLLPDVAMPAYVFSTMGFMIMLANGVNIALIMLWGTVREFTGSFSTALCVSGVCTLIVWFWAKRNDLEKGLR